MHSSVKKFSLLLRLGFLCLSCTAVVTAMADPLEDLLKSDELKQLERKTQKSQQKNKRRGILKINPNSNFGTLFVDRNGPEHLLDWLSPAVSDFSILSSKSRANRFKEYAVAETEISSPQNKKLLLLILVPHPKYLEAVKYDLIEAFKNTIPLPDEISKQKPVSAKENVTGTLYSLKDQSCVLNLNLDRGTRFHLKARACFERKELLDFVDTLDLKRFLMKINS